MAVGAIYAIQDAGLRVPNDIAVIGYDNQECSRITRPKISTITLPCYEMGQTAAELIINRLDDPSLPNEPIKIRGELIIRESTGNHPILD